MIRVPLPAITLQQLLVLLTFHKKPTTKTKENMFLGQGNKSINKLFF